MERLTIHFILKNGKDFTVKCSEFEVERSWITGDITEYKIKGIVDNNPIFIDMTEVAAIIQELPGEKAGGDDDG